MVSEVKDVEIPENFSTKYLTMSDGTRLRHVYYYPDDSQGSLFLFPGMNTLVLSWLKVLEGISDANFTIDYVESREKHTAILPKNTKITKERMIEDCIEAIQLLDLDSSKYTALGSSLGATTLLHCLSLKRIKPAHVVLVGPTIVFRVPFAIKMTMPFVNSWSYRNIGRKIMQKIVIRKYTNEEADPFQKKKYMLALDLAEPIRLKATMKTWDKNSIVELLGDIDGKTSKCYLIGATEDKLHDVDETMEIAQNIPNAEFVDLKTNTAAHDTPLIEMIINLN